MRVAGFDTWSQNEKNDDCLLWDDPTKIIAMPYPMSTRPTSTPNVRIAKMHFSVPLVPPDDRGRG